MDSPTVFYHESVGAKRGKLIASVHVSKVGLTDFKPYTKGAVLCHKEGSLRTA